MNALTAGFIALAFGVSAPAAFAQQGTAPVEVGGALAYESLEKAAKQGDAEAMKRLGDLYAGGGSKTDYGLARRWYTRAANGGAASAYASLSVLYLKGLGGAKDVCEAYRLSLEGAWKNDALSAYYAGLFFQNGECVAVERHQARSFFEKSASLGYAPAKQALSQLNEEFAKRGASQR